MSYRIDLLGMTDLTPHAALFDATIEQWSHRINAPGKFTFSLDANHPKATPDNLKIFRRVRLYRHGSPVWLGYIEDKNELDGRIEVICNGMVGFFAKRFLNADRDLSGIGSDVAFGLLSTFGAQTGITEGDGGVSTTRTLQTQGRIDVLKAWELLAQAHGAEFTIDTAGAFHFVPTLGSDQSESLILRYFRNGQPGVNVAEILIGESGRDMATRVIGVSGALIKQYDAATQAEYGLIEEVKQFNEAQDQATLDAMTTAYGSQRAYPVPDFQVSPSLSRKTIHPYTGERVVTGLGLEDVSVGDLVTVMLATENQNSTTVKRIAELIVTLDGDKEKLSLTLSEAGVFITAGYLDASRVDELRRRVKEIESVL